VDFDRYTVVLPLTLDDRPVLSEEAERLQDARLSHLARLHDACAPLAAGPVGDPGNR